jgi:hypothetical protein
MSLRKIRAELDSLREEISKPAQGSGAREMLASTLVKAHQRLLNNPDERPCTNMERYASPHMDDVEEAIARSTEGMGKETALAFALWAGKVCGPTHPASLPRLFALANE